MARNRKLAGNQNGAADAEFANELDENNEAANVNAAGNPAANAAAQRNANQQQNQ